MLQVSAVPLPSPRKGGSTPRPPCGWGWGGKSTVSIKKLMIMHTFQQKIQLAAADNSRSSLEQQQPAAAAHSSSCSTHHWGLTLNLCIPPT